MGDHYLTLTAIGLLFPTISVVYLAQTNRFMSLASVARDLVGRYRHQPDHSTRNQLRNLQHRIRLVRRTQGIGLVALLVNSGSASALFLDSPLVARCMFAGAMLCMAGSLATSLREIQLSVRAIDLELDTLL